MLSVFHLATLSDLWDVMFWPLEAGEVAARAVAHSMPKERVMGWVNWVPKPVHSWKKMINMIKHDMAHRCSQGKT